MNLKTGYFLHCIGALSLLLSVSACGGGGGGGGIDGAEQTQNQSPVISGAPDTHVLEGKPYSFSPTASDPDGDTLTFEADNIPGWAGFNVNTGELSGVPGSNDAGLYTGITISVSDGKKFAQLEAFDIDVDATINKDEIVVLGNSQDLAEQDLSEGADSGFITDGLVEFYFGDRIKQFETEDLRFEFDDDILISMEGNVLVPDFLTDYFSVTATPKARIGLYLGSEINAEPDFEIELKENTYYMVYYIGVSTDVEIRDRADGTGESISLSLPARGEILIIVDPLDEFFYYYGNTPFGAKGYGESDQGLIPFTPAEDFSSLDSFDGHRIDRDVMAFGIKVFDLLEIDGTRITQQAQFSDIDWQDPLNSTIEFKAGANGVANFALSVLYVGIFDFHLAQASATFDVGMDRQQMAMQMTVEPDVSWQPDWFSILPTTRVVGNWMVDGDDNFSALLSGSYRSTIPQAEMNGSITLNNDGAIFESLIPDDNMPITVRASFLEPSTIYEVLAQRDVSESIEADINDAFDRLVAEKQQAYQDYLDSIEDYEFEVSLRGVRETLPAIADQAITKLEALPAEVAQTAYNETYASIKARQICIGVCVPSDNRIGSYARTAENAARTRTEGQIVPYVSAMNELKFRALQADAEDVRQALEDSLYEAYNRRTYNDTVTVSFTVTEIDYDFTYNKTVSKTILNSQQSSSILEAANNAYRIQETSDIRIRLGDYYEQIPTEEIIEQAREDVNKDLKQLPGFEKAGMTVTNGEFTGFIVLSGKEYAVDFNILDPIELLLGIDDTIALQKSREKEESSTP